MPKQWPRLKEKQRSIRGCRPRKGANSDGGSRGIIYMKSLGNLIFPEKENGIATSGLSSLASL